MSRGEMRMHAVGETMDGSDYTNMHRAFLQAFLARSVMSFDEIKPVLAAVMNAGGKSPYLSSICPSSPDATILTAPQTQTGLHWKETSQHR
jgi:hypothetical protein